MGLITFITGRKPQLRLSSYRDHELEIVRYWLVAGRGYMCDFGGFTNDPSRAHPFDTPEEAVVTAFRMGYTVKGYQVTEDP